MRRHCWLMLFSVLLACGEGRVSVPFDASSIDAVNDSPYTLTDTNRQDDFAWPDMSVTDTVRPSDTQADTTPLDTSNPSDTSTLIDVVTDTGTPPMGGLCAPCQDQAQCGGADDYCLLNNATGESFCGSDCNSGCPSGFQCVLLDPWAQISQCVPTGQTCIEPVVCAPACAAGLICVNGQCVVGGQWEAELQYCVDLVNDYRAQHGRSTLARSAALEDCAGAGAQEDSVSGTPHGHFSSTSGCYGAARAENEIPGWSMGWAGSVMNTITQGTASMMDEGPGGGHYENILNSGHTFVGCGVFVTANNEVWIVQDFR